MDQPSPTLVAGGTSQPPDTRLRGCWVDIVRGLWVMLFLLNLVWFGIALVSQVAAIQHPCPGATCLLTLGQAASLRHAGISANVFAAYFIGIPILIVLANSAIALLLFWRRSDDWFALLVGLFLLYPISTFAYGSNNIVMVEGLGTGVLVLLIGFVDTIVYYTVLLIFPDGRFVPRWTWILLVGWMALHVSEAFAPRIPHSLVWIGLTYPLLYLSVIAVQVYRYRRVSTARQRQQTKWVVLGVSVALSANILYWIVLPLAFPAFQQAGSIYPLVAFPLYELATIALPISFAVAIQRNQLFDVDKLINRTLVYGTLTVILAVVYGAVVYAAQLVGGLLTGLSTPPPWVIVIVTLLVAALFNPLRQRLQVLIDRRFYRSRYDATRTVEAFAATLRTELDLADLSAHLVGVVQETMQPAHVSLWLRAPSPPVRSAAGINAAMTPLPQAEPAPAGQPALIPLATTLSPP
jgi:hypothetical protein